MSIEIAWCAGLFEGEGCFGSYRSGKGRRFYPRAYLASTDEDVVRRFHSYIGVGKVYGPRLPRNPKHKPQWHWETNGLEAFKLVGESFRDYLCKRRLARYEEILSQCEHQPQAIRDSYKDERYKQTKAYVWFGKRFNELSKDERLGFWRVRNKERAVFANSVR